MQNENSDDDVSVINCDTSKGPISLELHRDWSPNGYDRALELFRRGFYDDSHFFRVVPGFLVQFGISYSTDHELQKFSKSSIMDDPSVGIKFEPGIISFAGSGDNSRTSHLFISYGSSQSLGTQKWETPIGKVISGMENAREFYSYGDMPPWGKGPVQGKIYSGKDYIMNEFPLTDYFKTCEVVKKVPTTEEEVFSNEEEEVTEEQRHEVQEEEEELKHHQQQVEQQKLYGKGKSLILSKEKLHKHLRKLHSYSHMNDDSDPVLILLVLVFMGMAIVFLITNALRRKQKEDKSV